MMAVVPSASHRELSTSTGDGPSAGTGGPAAPPADGPAPSVLLLRLPEEVLYAVLRYAAPPTERAHVLCHRLAPLCSALRDAVESGLPGVWTAILSEEYGDSSGATAAAVSAGSGRSRRSSKRLRRDPKSHVESAHRLLLDRTDVAHYAVTEMAHSARTSLTLSRLRWVVREYGPHLRVNHRADVGGTLLVECCRARHVREGTVLSCVRELVERHGADPDLAAARERVGGYGGRGRAEEAGLTPLCVASARGMPAVVKFLLGAGASPRIAGTGRFRLHCNASKSVFGTHEPLGFARAMREAEVSNGAAEESLADLEKCIKLLERAVEERMATPEGACRRVHNLGRNLDARS